MRSCLFALVLLLLPASAWAGVKETIATLAPTATVLVLDSKGDELIAQNADTPFVPASRHQDRDGSAGNGSSWR